MEVLLDNSRSKTGKHVIASVIYRVEGETLTDIATVTSSRGVKVFPCKPLYRKGECKKYDLLNGTYVYLMFVRNIYGRVTGRGYVVVNGSLVLEVKYRKQKVVYIKGEKKFSKLLKIAFDKGKVPVKRSNVW